MRWFTVLICILFLSCATIHNYRTLEQPQNQMLTVSIGGTIFRLNKSSDLPNAFGKADLYGGKVDRGYAELKYVGLNERGELILQTTDISFSSSETTMDRYRPGPKVNMQQSINIGKNSPESTTFLFDPKKQNDLVIAGVRVTFVNIQSYSVSYRLADTRQ